MRTNFFNASHRIGTSVLLGAAGVAACAPPVYAQTGGIYDLTWSTIDCGGDTAGSTGGIYAVSGTVGQPDAGQTGASGQYTVLGGFWAVIAPDPCYANCDGSTVTPILNINDFVCFAQRFASGDPWANCDGSTAPPTLNVNDFICFQQAFAAACP